MSPAAQDQHNIFEVVIREALRDPAAKVAPRIYVCRHTLAEKSFCEMLTPPRYDPFPLISTFLEGAHPVVDIASRFRLTPNWIPTEENKFVELDFDHYSKLPGNKQDKIEFSFAEPVIAGDEGVFYAVSNRGFLWAHGFICVFSGSFEEPKAHKLITVWWS